MLKMLILGRFKVIRKIVSVREVTTVTEFKLMFVLFCFSSDFLICASQTLKFINYDNVDLL